MWRSKPLARPDAPCLEGENRTYTPFIVLATPRSGSSLVIQSIRAHPHAVAFGEVFNPKRIGFNTPGFDNHDRKLRRARDRDPVGFIERIVYGAYASDVRVAGFKVFYRHLDGVRDPDFIHRLRSWPGLRVIHLTRRNQLRAFLSAEIAKRTGVWGIEAEEERTPLTVELDPDACVRFFRDAEETQRRYAGVFEACQVLDLEYEAFVDDLEASIAATQRFLGLEPHIEPPKILRQETRPLSEAIANYDAVSARLADSPWAGFLE